MTAPSATASGDHAHGLAQSWDAVETYFQCITTCSIDDGECITRCVEELKETDA